MQGKILLLEVVWIVNSRRGSSFDSSEGSRFEKGMQELDRTLKHKKPFREYWMEDPEVLDVELENTLKVLSQ